MRWDQIYNLLERDASLLKDPSLAKLLKARLQEMEEERGDHNEEALRCRELLDLAESYQHPTPPQEP
jgi:hypothetical protein